MKRLQLIGEVDDHGKLEAELPNDFPSGKVLITVESLNGDLEAESRGLEVDPRFQEAEKRIRPKMYARARAYWKANGDHERLALTDEQLDKQFWLFDPEGIPRLKADQDKISLPPDPFEIAADRQWERWHKENKADKIGTDDIDTRGLLNEDFPRHLLRRMENSDGDQ